MPRGAGARERDPPEKEEPTTRNALLRTAPAAREASGHGPRRVAGERAVWCEARARPHEASRVGQQARATPGGSARLLR